MTRSQGDSKCIKIVQRQGATDGARTYLPLVNLILLNGCTSVRVALYSICSELFLALLTTNIGKTYSTSRAGFFLSKH